MLRLLSILKILQEELAQVHLPDSFTVGRSDRLIHADDVLGVIVIDPFQIAELPSRDLFVGNEVGRLNIEPTAIFLGNEVDLCPVEPRPDPARSIWMKKTVFIQKGCSSNNSMIQ
jgi:hypothetical protein